LGLDPLDNAPAHARYVAQTLAGFEYEEIAALPEHADGEQLIESLVTASDIAVLIVHVVGHGELADGSSEKLYVLGSDAMRLRHSVRSWIEWIEDHPDRHRPVTLFVLDVCYAGEAAVTAWHARMEVARRRAWVLAATGPRDQAFGYRLSRALVQVLDRYLRGELRIDPSVRYIPANTLWKEVEAAVRELVAQESGLPQSVLTSLVPSHADLSSLPFFPNPGFVEDAPAEQLPPAIARLADLAADPLHFMRRAGGAEPVQRNWREGYFSGRFEDLSRLASWLDDECTGPALCAVTGKPGAGKSALLGMLVCAAHPDLRDYTRPLWRGLADTVPGTNDQLLVIHARHLSLDDVMRGLSRQLRRLATSDRESLPTAASGEESTASFFALLQDSHQQSQRPVTIIIDALDEANAPEVITEALLYPLLRRYKGMARLLIATRKDARANVLLTARTGSEVLDLDTTIPEELYEGLVVYVKRLLAAAGPYTAGSMRQAGNALAEAMANRLADTGEEPAAPTRPDLLLGEFLAAGIYVNFMLAGAEHSSETSEAAQSGDEVPRSLPELLEMGLQRHGDQFLLRAVLTALAFAEGQGMPERVLADVVAFDPTGQGRKVPLQALYHLLDNEARLYLSRSVEEDGTTLYRLFHHVAEWWRASAGDDDRTRLYEGLVASVRRDEHDRPLWHLAAPYLQRHLPQHAADAKRLGEVLEDSDYLVFADPSRLLKLLPHAAGFLEGQAEANAAAYTLAFAEQPSMPLDARRQLLAVSAAMSGNPLLQTTLESSTAWTVNWAVCASSTPTVLAAFTSQDRPYAVTGSELGRIDVWDVHTGRAVSHAAAQRGRRRTRGTSEVQALSAVDSPAGLRIVTAGYGVMRIWDPVAGALVRELRGPAGSTSMTTVQIEDRCSLLVGGYGGFSVWDLEAGLQTGELTDHQAWVDALALAYVQGRPHIVAGADNGRIQVWDLAAKNIVHELAGHDGPVNALAITRVGRRPCAVSSGEEGIVYLWDLVTGRRRGELADHQGDAVTGLAVVYLLGQPYAVTGHASGRTALWDLTTRTCSATFQLPPGITAVTMSADGTVLVTFTDGIAAFTHDAISKRSPDCSSTGTPRSPGPRR
jgi:hypothetical protein